MKLRIIFSDLVLCEAVSKFLHSVQNLWCIKFHFFGVYDSIKYGFIHHLYHINLAKNIFILNFNISWKNSVAIINIFKIRSFSILFEEKLIIFLEAKLYWGRKNQVKCSNRANRHHILFSSGFREYNYEKSFTSISWFSVALNKNRWNIDLL